jgi:predicted nucleic acid-binding protein
MELLAWKNATPHQINVLENFIAACTVHPLDEQTIVASIATRRDFNIKLPDAIIASTAIVNNFTLVTRNIADFRSIPNLGVMNSWE